MILNAKTVLDFWFKELSPQDWFRKDDILDQRIQNTFFKVFEQACQGELYCWRKTIQGRLAEIIVLDQFARNIYRDDARAFLFDPMALVLSQEASRLRDCDLLTNQEKAFLYMPHMHSESLFVHEQAVKLFSVPGLEYNLEFELKHKKIIERFGRYPHRNEVLGRISTPEEISFLGEEGSSF